MINLMDVADVRFFKPLLSKLGIIRNTREFIDDDRGVTAIEFAFLALPFFLVVIATFETGVAFLASNVFESAVHNSTRLIRTGQAANAGFDASDFRAEICDRSYGFFDCSKIKVRVREINSFGGATVAVPIEAATGNWTITESYDGGAGRSIVVAEAYYKWDVLADFMGFSLANSADGTMLMGAASVWKNEPFGG